ncbi:hypothetical protein SRHO_G00135740 [Serrasalmus rhombeus]
MNSGRTEVRVFVRLPRTICLKAELPESSASERRLVKVVKPRLFVKEREKNEKHSPSMPPPRVGKMKPSSQKNSIAASWAVKKAEKASVTEVGGDGMPSSGLKGQ